MAGTSAGAKKAWATRKGRGGKSNVRSYMDIKKRWPARTGKPLSAKERKRRERIVDDIMKGALGRKR